MSANGKVLKPPPHMDSMLDSAEPGAESGSSLLRQLAHELRDALSPLASSADLARQRNFDPEASRLLAEKVERGLRRALAILDAFVLGEQCENGVTERHRCMWAIIRRATVRDSRPRNSPGQVYRRFVCRGILARGLLPCPSPASLHGDRDVHAGDAPSVRRRTVPAAPRPPSPATATRGAWRRSARSEGSRPGA